MPFRIRLLNVMLRFVRTYGDVRDVAHLGMLQQQRAAELGFLTASLVNRARS
jgi:hypothetical protein